MARESRVTVVITTFRRERLLLEAIDSVRAQRGVQWQVLVVDDSREASARSVVEGLRDPRVKYMSRHQPSGGHPGAVRNSGARVVRTPLLHFLDDDDHLADGALAALAHAIEKTGAGMALGHVVAFGTHPVIVEQSRIYYERCGAMLRDLRGRRNFAAELLFRESFIVNSSCMIRRDVFETAGGYDESIRCYEDVEFYLRVGREHGFTFVDRPVLYYRVGAPSLMQPLRETENFDVLRGTYRIMYDRYRRQYGDLEFFALKAMSKGPRLQHPAALAAKVARRAVARLRSRVAGAAAA